MQLPGSYVSNDIFFRLPSSSGSSSSTTAKGKSDSRRTTLLFLLPGNPGLLAYYHTFLGLLIEQSKSVEDECAMVGFSLGGFETDEDLEQRIGKKERRDDNDDDDALGHDNGEGAGNAEQGQEDTIREMLYPQNFKRLVGASDAARGFWALTEQIELSFARLEAVVDLLQAALDKDKSKQIILQDLGREGEVIDVVLMGHSVGAYIALEIVRLWNLRYKTSLSTSPSTSTSTSPEASKNKPTWKPRAAMLLTPTILDIHLSPSGRIAAPLLGTFSFFPSVMQSLAGVLRWGVNRAWVRWLVGILTGMKQEDGKGLQTTVRWLLSGNGVRQALGMAGDEMRLIREDSWDDKVWSNPQTTDTDSDGERVKLYCLFAKRDHWVADETRRAIVEGGKVDPRRVVADEESGLVHAWCLRQSEMVAEVVGNWVRETLDE